MRHLVRIVQAVTSHQLRLLGAALHETGDLQAESVVLPFDRGNRQVAVLQALAGAHVGPAQHLAVEHHERLDAEAGARRLQGAVLAHQRLLAAAVQAQQGPVRLLAGEAPRQRPARQVARDRAHEIIGRGGELQRLQADVADAIAPAGPVDQIEPQVARLGLGQGQPIAAATTGGHLAQPVPVAAVDRGLHDVARGFQPRHPLDHRAAELTHLAQVQADGLLLDPAADPHRIRLAVGNALLQRSRGVGDHRGGQCRGVLLRQRLQGELVEAHRALAPHLAVDGELHRGAAPQDPVLARPPGLFDVALAVAHPGPVLREAVTAAVDPPHVVAAGVDQLELQVVGRRIAAQAETHLVVVRPGDIQPAADAGIAGHLVEVVVQAQRAAAVAGHRPQRAADLRRGDQLPGADVVELRQHPASRLGGQAVAGQRRGGKQHGGKEHSHSGGSRCGGNGHGGIFAELRAGAGGGPAVLRRPHGRDAGGSGAPAPPCPCTRGRAGQALAGAPAHPFTLPSSSPWM